MGIPPLPPGPRKRDIRAALAAIEGDGFDHWLDRRLRDLFGVPPTGTLPAEGKAPIDGAAPPDDPPAPNDEAKRARPPNPRQGT